MKIHAKKLLIAISALVVFVILLISTSGLKTRAATLAPADPSLVYGDSEVPVILPRSTWNNSPELNALMTWMPDNNKYPSDWQPVERIIVHHSATPTDDPYPAISRIQSIYRYHSVTQGWGDIGYNYIIDRDGKIYEGRYGGNGSRAAHTYYDKEHDNFNYGSIGIVLLGTYASQDISPTMYDSLSRLVGWLATVNGIDPLQMNRVASVWSPTKGGFVSSYTLPAVLGHKDIEGTTCPGLVDLNKVRQYAGVYKNLYQNYVYQQSSANKPYYSIQNGIRKIYGSLAEYAATGLQYTKIVLVDLSQINLFSEQRFSKYVDGALIKVKGSSFIYLIDEGKVRPFEMAPEQFIQLGYSFNSAKEISKDEFDLYLPGRPIRYGPDSSLVKGASDPQVYYIEKGKKRPISSAALFDFLGFVWSKIKNLANEEIDSFLADTAMSYPDGSLVKSDNSSIVYLINNQKISPFLSANIFETLKYNWNNIKTLPQSEINSFVVGEPVKYPERSLIKAEDSPFVYVIKNNQKILVPTAGAFEAAGYKWSDIITLSVGEFNALYPGSAHSTSSGQASPPQAGGTVAGANTPTETAPDTPNNSNTTADNSASPSQDGPLVRIAIQDIPAGQSAIISASGAYKQCDTSNNCQTKTGQTTIPYSTSVYAKFIPEDSSVILRLDSYSDLNWNKSSNYNQFRGSLEIKYSPKSQKLWVVNELGLEDYLKGIGEVNNGEVYGYIKTLIVAARTYAYYYIQQGGKYGADEIFHLDNTPSCQLYKGYGREALAPDIVKAVNESRGEIITYNNQPIVSAYSSGAAEVYNTGTRGACSVWGGKYCQAGYKYLSGGVKDPAGAPYTRTTCGADNHCVGMSAAGGRRLIEMGRTYKDVLTYYYKGTTINSVY